jgi:hypothetical protein
MFPKIYQKRFLILVSVLILRIGLQSPAYSYSTSFLEIFSTDDLNTRIPDVEILLYRENSGSPQSYTSNESGFVFIRNINPGRYRVKTFKSGFDTLESEWFIVYPSNSVHIILRMNPILTCIPDRIIKQPVTVWYDRYPSIKSVLHPEISFGDSVTDIRQIETSLPFIMMAENQIPVLAGTKNSDSSLYINGIRLFDPLTGIPFMYPNQYFIQSIGITVAGVDPCSEASPGYITDLAILPEEEGSLSGLIGVGKSIANRSHLGKPEAEAAFRDWDPDGSHWTDADLSPEIDSLTYHWLLKSRIKSFYAIASGQWLKSDSFSNSDYVNDDANSDWNVWINAGNTFTDNLETKAVIGIENQWLRLRNPYALRELNPVYTKNQKYTAIVSGEYQNSQSMVYRITLLRQSGSTLEGPPSGSSSFKTPDRFLRFHSTDEYPDIPFLRDGTSDLSRIQLDMLRSSTLHHIEIGGAAQFFGGVWSDKYYNWGEDGNLQLAENWLFDHDDYQIGMWGRDRWFATRNLEIVTGLRWDRIHYLDRADQISPRFHAAMKMGKCRILGGFERIIAAPGMLYLFQHDADDSSEPLDTSPILPETGSRWFSGIESFEEQKITGKVNFYYSLLSNPVEFVTVHQLDTFRTHQVINGDSESNMGLIFEAKTQPANWITLELIYSWNRNRVQWAENFPTSNADIRIPDRFDTDKIVPEPGSEFPSITSFTHSVCLKNTIIFKALYDLMIGMEYRFVSGRPYTPLSIDTSAPERPYLVGETNSETGPSWHRLDVNLNKHFQIWEQFMIHAGISVKNVFNSFQDPPVDPYTGDPTVDPYSPDNNLPTTVSAEVDFIF